MDKFSMRTTRGLLWAITATAIAGSSAVRSAPAHTDVNIVLVHGALIDGSSWRGVYDVLTRDGYRVSIVQEPLTGFEEDVAATRRVLERQDGPVVMLEVRFHLHPAHVGDVHVSLPVPTRCGNGSFGGTVFDLASEARI